MHPDEEQSREEDDDNGEDDGDDDNSEESDEGSDIHENKTWFDRPMDYIDFKDSFRGMTTEVELEALRLNAQENQSTCEVSQERNDPYLDADIEASGDMKHLLNPLLDQMNRENDRTADSRTKKSTILVPGVGERYKSTVIAELRNNPSLSTEHLQRIRNASVNLKDACTPTKNQLSSCAFHERQITKMFVLGHVQRMRKKGKRGFIEYVKPVSLDERPKDAEVIFSKYVFFRKGEALFPHRRDCC